MCFGAFLQRFAGDSSKSTSAAVENRTLSADLASPVALAAGGKANARDRATDNDVLS
jgi:hypothetical protein